MIFKKLIMKNFRQYYGEQEIEFASDKEKSITILFGENGKGKTGIYRAVMFGLFGMIHISQDNKEEKIHITNFKYLNEVHPKPAFSSVTLIFEHENMKYILERELSSIKNANDKVIEKLGDCKLTKIDANGNLTPDIIEDKITIESEINTILNEEIKDFFLFDAEKIDTLAKSEPKIRKEVKQAIFSMLNIDKIEEGKTLLNEHINSIKSELQSKIKDDGLIEKRMRLNEQEDELNKLQLLINERQKNINALEEKIEKNKLILDKSEEILKIKNEIIDLQVIQSDLEKEKVEIGKDLVKQLCNYAPFLLLNDQLLENKTSYENFLGDKKIKIDVSILQESLHKNLCIICNSDLEKNIDGKINIEKLIENFSNSVSSDIVRDILYMVDNNTPVYDERKTDLKNQLKNYHVKNGKIIEIQKNIQIMEGQIGYQAKNDTSLHDIQNMIEIDNEEIKELNRLVIIEEHNISNLKEEIIDLKKDIHNIELRSIDDKKIKMKLNRLYELKDDLHKISTEFNEDIRIKLGELTTEIFIKLIDKKDKDVIDKVNINRNFEINALNYQGLDINQDISQGQRQVLALSFIAALSKIAVNNTNSNVIDYPLFMDSPFNRLSGNNRDNLIRLLPDLTSQWILLLTDTEFTQTEESVFKKTNKLGKWYKINQIETNHSEIEEVSLDETMATRGSSE
ncbi:hypothetical protein BHM04_08110 [Macrococcus sp. IME1552]|nr:AAA family ATPase [Macrococcus sp. IME1552]ATD31154.1 hypothetical protein BHM04_08110 [Macrococcus sp. IME1552]